MMKWALAVFAAVTLASTASAGVVDFFGTYGALGGCDATLTYNAAGCTVSGVTFSYDPTGDPLVSGTGAVSGFGVDVSPGTEILLTDDGNRPAVFACPPRRCSTPAAHSMSRSCSIGKTSSVSAANSARLTANWRSRSFSFFISASLRRAIIPAESLPILRSRRTAGRDPNP